ncbi:hypothetical protein ACM9XA_15485 [Xanthomonas sacchari]
MKDIRLLVLKLAQLELEHSADALHKAMDLLDSAGGARGLLRAVQRKDVVVSDASKMSASKLSGSVSQDRFLSVRKIDERKYALLKEFEKLLLSGAVLPQFDHLRKFGAAVSKRFSPRKSRKESIYPLLAVIAEMPVGQVERLIDMAKMESSTDSDSSYQGLAEFIISGKKSV